MSKNVLVCENVSVRFSLTKPANRWRLLFDNTDWGDWHEALNNISFKVPKGTVVGVIGRNGAGKSTLLRSMVGLYPLFRGRVVRLGQISSLFELGGTAGIFISGKQYITRWLSLNGVSKKNWSKIIKEVAEFSELYDKLDEPIYSYSTGMAARLYFSTATSIDQDIYLIDEVLSVGDEHFQAKCWARIRYRLGRGISGVIVTHDWTAILKICKHALKLENGQILAAGNPEKIICDYLNVSSQLNPNSPAKFTKNCPLTLTARSGKDWGFDIPIKNTGKESVLFNFTIEKLEIANDWQVIFFGDQTKVASSEGSYVIQINITKLPLPPAEYRLNLFLNGPNQSNGTVGPSYDSRSWTTGNSIRLVVVGEPIAGLVLIPFRVDLK